MRIRPTIGLYVVDQNPLTTTTIGVYNYTRRVIKGLAGIDDPGFDVVVWLNEENTEDLAPRACPEWMRIRSVTGGSGSGWRRLYSDHFLAPRLARQDQVDAVHFPKGWLPVLPNFRVRSVVTLHDAISVYCRRRSCTPKGNYWKWRYFESMLRFSLKRADEIIAPTYVTSKDLVGICASSKGRIRVVPTGALEPVDHQAPIAERQGILVLGSIFPHKATAETLNLLNEYARARGPRLQVTMTGVEDVCCVPGVKKLDRLDITCEGRVADDRLKECIRGSRALVFLSVIEGFGLPLLEAYSAGTPVCYRRSGSLVEILENTPGGWDGDGTESFNTALDETLSLSDSDIQVIRNRLGERYPPSLCIEGTVAVYRELFFE